MPQVERSAQPQLERSPPKELQRSPLLHVRGYQSLVLTLLKGAWLFSLGFAVVSGLCLLLSGPTGTMLVGITVIC